MFIPVMVGREESEKTVKYIDNIKCKNCGNIAQHKLVKRHRSYNLFTLSVYKKDSEYYIVSKCCSIKYKLSAGKGELLEAGNSVIINDYELVKEEPKQSFFQQFKCSHCGKIIVNKFQYCPSCGGKIR